MNHPALAATLSAILLLISAANASAQTRVFSAASLRSALPSTSPSQVSKDPVSDGVLKGALIGAAAGVALVAIGYATCDDTCDAPARLPMFTIWTAFGAGIGATAGWVTDSLRHERSFRIALKF